MSHPRAAVVGLGISGRGAARLLHERGYSVTLFDQVATQLPDDLNPLHFELRSDPDATRLSEQIIALAPALVVLSPGVPESSPISQLTRQSGLDVIGEVELAFRIGTAQSDPARWLAVTGTNGKTTTVGMVGAILARAGLDAIETGNIGYPVTRAVTEGHEVLVAELSSFQLATTATLAPWASICLNVDSDHLDWHGSIEAYRSAKSRVYDRVQRARLVFADDPVVAAMACSAADSDGSLVVPLTFGVVASGDIGVVDGVLIDLAFLDSADDEPEVADLSQVPVLRTALSNRDGASSPLVRDALAAAGLARSLGVAGVDIIAGLRDFKMAPHRFALVPTEDGRTWIDDSKATNVHAASAALENMLPRTTAWILGGDTKGQDLSSLIATAADRVKAVVVIGSDQQEILRLLAEHAPQLPVTAVSGDGEPREWMKEVVRACLKMTEPGDSVLLAPACASWDQFANYSQRGDVFVSAVKEVVGGEG